MGIEESQFAADIFCLCPCEEAPFMESLSLEQVWFIDRIASASRAWEFEVDHGFICQ